MRPTGFTQNTVERIDAIRRVYKSGMSARQIGAAIGVTKGVVCSLYNRYPDQFADCPLQTYSGGKMAKDRIRKRRAEKPSVWTPERRARVAELLKQKLSSTVIGQELGVSRNAIIGLLNRDPALSAIGLQGTRYVPRRLSDEERMANRIKSKQKYRSALREPQPTSERKPFRPVVVSHNTALMVADWIAANGVRRFEAKESSDYYQVQAYIAERGWQVSVYGGRYKMSGPNGRSREVKWRDVLVVADRFRVAEGKPPFLARERQSA